MITPINTLPTTRAYAGRPVDVHNDNSYRSANSDCLSRGCLHSLSPTRSHSLSLSLVGNIAMTGAMEATIYAGKSDALRWMANFQL